MSNKSQVVAQAIQQSVARSQEVAKPSPTQVIPAVKPSNKGVSVGESISPETLKLLQALKDSL